MSENKNYIEALVKGDEKQILDIYNLFFPKVKSFIIRNKGKEEDAKDVFHDALIYLIMKQKESPLNISSFEGYLFTICKNLWRSKLKNQKEWVMKDDILTLHTKENDLSFFILEQERLEFYQEKFQLLSDNCKEILSNYFNGMNYEELMKELSYNSINVVRQRVFKCRAKITKLIKIDERYKKLI